MRSLRPLFLWAAVGVVALSACTSPPADAPDAPAVSEPAASDPEMVVPSGPSTAPDSQEPAPATPGSEATVPAATGTDLPATVPPDPGPSVEATLEISREFVPADPTAIANDALSNVVCTADAAGVWSFSGTLTNTSDTAATFSVAVAVGSTSSVAGHATIQQEVPAGGTAEVRADAFADGAPASSTCQAVVSR